MCVRVLFFGVRNIEFLLTFEQYFESMINSIYRGVCVLRCCFLDSEISSFCLLLSNILRGMINSIYRGVCVLGCCFLDSEIWSFCLLLSNFRDFINFIWDFGVSN